MTADMLAEEIWAVGDHVVAPTRGPVNAAAELHSQQVGEVGLQLESAPGPHPAHAELTGWPEAKEKLIAVAKDLADRATLHIRHPHP